jgi:hypothetical protein
VIPSSESELCKVYCNGSFINILKKMLMSQCIYVLADCEQFCSGVVTATYEYFESCLLPSYFGSDFHDTRG